MPLKACPEALEGEEPFADTSRQRCALPQCERDKQNDQGTKQSISFREHTSELERTPRPTLVY
ncbi:hypothetical protein Lnau_1383 [Legionella nautarum]|uniref:Uncharacterized protein n=1 Tax=Legionella nautarum TaxID=45070 RepID=A0A0W0WVS2_9GAMM|nr:hypothetical protein [Legionella nautarum]KTD36399.1 hypothetical protein Lnau_1383 [Legionella nautarum]